MQEHSWQKHWTPGESHHQERAQVGGTVTLTAIYFVVFSISVVALVFVHYWEGS